MSEIFEKNNKISDVFLVIDASSFLYRAFHAMPDLRSKDGFPTGAITGIINMLLKVKQDWPSTYSVCVFDPVGKTFRDDIYKDYKANRSSMPKDLSKQVPVIFELIKHIGWPSLTVPGYEADDVIGTLVKKAENLNLKSVIISGDKDLAQLVNKNVTLVDTMTRAGAESLILDEKGVKKKFGVCPEKIIDYLTLVGDTSDNIPGVEKIGPKTAINLLSEFDSLENLIKNALSVKGVVGKNLRDSLNWLPTGKSLVTIKTSLNLEKQFGDFKNSFTWQISNKKKLSELKEKFDLNRVLKTFLDDNEKEISSDSKLAENKIKPNYKTIISKEDLDWLIKKITESELVAFDTETTSLNVKKASLVGISFSWGVGHAAYIPIAHQDTVIEQLNIKYVLEQLAKWFNSFNEKVAHNLKYDMHILENYGVILNGSLHDTLLQSYILEAHRRHDLSSLSDRHLGRKGLAYEDVAGKGAKQVCFSAVPIELASKYSCEDSDFTYHLHKTLFKKIKENKKAFNLYANLEIPCLSILSLMETTGVCVDCNLLDELTKDLSLKISDLEKKSHELAGEKFNLGSPKQIGKILFEKLEYKPIKKTAGGSPSTDESVLEKLSEDYPLPKKLLEWRTLSKLKSTYTEKIPRMINSDTGRVHTTFSQAVAVTGRLASSDPNLQNIPIKSAEGRKIRSAFIAPPNQKIVAVDYSQIELRIMAHLSEDFSLMKAFADGLDVHSATASELFSISCDAVSFEQRRTAKVINFGLIYGMSAFGLAKSLNLSREAAKNYIDKYFIKYPGVASFMEKTKLMAKEKGYVETVLGRRLWLPEINSPNGPRRQASERAAINAPMQGTAADLIKMSMINVNEMINKENFKAKMILQVHDELVFEVLDSEVQNFSEIIKKVMCSVMQFKVPLEVDIGVGSNWEEAH